MATPIAAPIMTAPMYGGLTRSASATPSMASQIAGRKACQRGVTGPPR
jgi:hypothetical protein